MNAIHYRTPDDYSMQYTMSHIALGVGAVLFSCIRWFIVLYQSAQYCTGARVFLDRRQVVYQQNTLWHTIRKGLEHMIGVVIGMVVFYPV